MFIIKTIDETWGNQDVLCSRTLDTYADAKGYVCKSIDRNVKQLVSHGFPYRVRVLEEAPRSHYKVLLEWCEDGKLAPEDGTPVGGEGLQVAAVFDVSVV